MGNTLVIYKIYPNEVGEEDKIIESVKKITIAEVKDVKKEPVAFGMCVVRLGVLFLEKQERLEEFEKAIRAIKEVSDVEVEGMTLL
ncbi:MAG: hypothetical protein AABW72_01900 [archaeon]